MIKSLLRTEFCFHLFSFWVQHERLFWFIFILENEVVQQASINSGCKNLRCFFNENNTCDESTFEMELADIIKKLIENMKFEISWDNEVEMISLGVCHTTDGRRPSVVNQRSDFHLLPIVHWPNMQVLFCKWNYGFDVWVVKQAQHFVGRWMSFITPRVLETKF